MAMTKGKNRREELLREMQKLVRAKVNDGVKLAYLSEEQVDLIDSLDLRALTEFQRSGNGAVEVKFNDRMKAMEQILNHTEGEEQGYMEALLSALGGEEQGV